MMLHHSLLIDQSDLADSGYPLPHLYYDSLLLHHDIIYDFIPYALIVLLFVHACHFLVDPLVCAQSHDLLY